MFLRFQHRLASAVFCASVAALCASTAPALAKHGSGGQPGPIPGLPDLFARGIGNHGHGFGRNLLSGQALDLTSTTTSIQLSKRILGTSTIQINVGGSLMDVQAGTPLTPAELVAVNQVLAAGTANQKIVINSDGQAIGGVFSVGALHGPPLKTLVIPEGVSAVGLAGKNPLRVSGALLLGDPQDPLATGGSLFGLESTGKRPFLILVHSTTTVGIGGLISTDIPSALIGVTNKSPVDIFLQSMGDVVNGGSIIATGQLKVFTHGQFINSLPAGADPSVSPLPVVSGVQGVILSAAGGATFNPGLVASAAGSININTKNASVIIGTDDLGNSATFMAGTLSSMAPLTGVLAKSDIVSSGGISIRAGSISMADLAVFTSNGGDISLTAARGDLTMGDSNQFAANGGNILLLASGTVSGGQENSFVARAVDSGGGNGQGNGNGSSSGGGIEIGSGLTNSMNLQAAFNGPGGIAPDPSVLGSNVVINNNGGVVEANKSGGGTIDLSSSGANTATLTLNRGAIVFDALHGGSVQFDGGTFTVDALRPVSYQQSANHDAELVVDTGEGIFDEQEDEGPLAVVN